MVKAKISPTRRSTRLSTRRMKADNVGRQDGYNLRNLPKVTYFEPARQITKTKKRKANSVDHSVNPCTRVKRSKPNRSLDEPMDDLQILFDDMNGGSWYDFNQLQYADGVTPDTVNLTIDYVSATTVKNYLLKDPCLDWLKIHYQKSYNPTLPIGLQQLEQTKFVQKVNKETTQMNVLFEMGNKFEEMVCNDLKTKYPNKFATVVPSNTYIQPNHMLQTEALMKQGVEIISQAALYNHHNHTFGVADLLVRSDFVNTIFKKPVLLPEEIHIPSPKLRKNYHYVVIDIKWTTMPLCSNGMLILNSKRIPSYKGQLAIYNAALGILQGYTPSKAYILAKAWKYKKNNRTYEGYNCFDRLGCIDYDGWDEEYIDETAKAIKWVRNVRYNGANWSVYPPTRPELYPNMCNRNDAPYHSVKQDIASKIHELTEIWKVGVTNRKIGHSNNVFGWNDPRCTSKVLGINGKQTAPVVNRIIQVNRDNDTQIYPSIIQNNVDGWQTQKDIEFWVDFESLNGCFYDRTIDINNSYNETGILFMIGVGYEEDNQWHYKCFHIKRCTLMDERKMIQEFVDFIEQKVQDHKYNDTTPVLFHWSNAECTLFNAANRRHHYQWTNWLRKMKWLDFCEVFVKEPIVINGAKKFGLKVVANAMYAHGMISTKWNSSGPSDGLSAMISATEYYRRVESQRTSRQDIQMFNQIIEYNEVDCKALWDIVRYLRKNHCA